MMSREQVMLLGRLFVAALAIALAFVRFVFFDATKDRMDSTFLILVGAAALALLVPWERLTGLKAGGLELTLEKPAVKDALEQLPEEHTVEKGIGAQVDKVVLNRSELKEAIRRLEPLLHDARGGRILWIDDHPHMLLPERRLFRAMGFEIVTATDSVNATRILRADNDFDLVITDVKRRPKERAPSDPDQDLGGVDFVTKRIRKDWDPHMKNLPVIFYSAYDLKRLMALTEDARRVMPPADICNNPHDLVVKAVNAIWLARSQPLRGPLGKREHYLEKSLEPRDLSDQPGREPNG